MTGVLVVAILWVGSGLIVTIVMARRGHDVYTWWILGALFGPLTLVLAADQSRRDRGRQAITLSAGADHGGPVDVLAGVDGSDAAVGAAAAVAEMLGPRLGRLTVAYVVEPEAVEGVTPGRDVAEGLATAAAARLGAFGAGAVVLSGIADRALPRHALDEGYELLVVGPHGSGGRRPFGGVATRLSRGSAVPVVIAARD